jgi:hypothetical protein
MRIAHVAIILVCLVPGTHAASGRISDLLYGTKKLTYSGRYINKVKGNMVPPWQATVVMEITGNGGDFVQGVCRR